MYNPHLQQGSPSKPPRVYRQNSATARGEHAFHAHTAGVTQYSYNPDAKYAFVNFRTELARMLAIQRAAHQLFDEKRLDCRIRQNGLRRSTKVNYGLEAGRPGQPISLHDDQPESLQHKVDELSHYPETDVSQYRKEKFFILKSCSMETLYQSLASGSWHVPRRHVERLNHAFQTARNVYLIFSVNGSGLFFGYALMCAEIRYEDGSIPPHDTRTPGDNHSNVGDSGLIDIGTGSELGETSRRQSFGSCDTLSSTGPISYEPERRKITWHAPWAQPCLRDRSPLDLTSSSPMSPSLLDIFAASNPDALLSTLPNFAESCRIKWLSTQNIPFDEIRGLKNSWNNDKEVHIARNVTPVEPTVAVALLKHW